MDAAKQYEWAKYLAQAALITDKSAREAEMLKRLVKLKEQMAKLYGSDESKWRHLYLDIKAKASQKEIEYKQAALAKAQVQAAVTAPIYASALLGRPLTGTESAMTSRAAVVTATQAVASKYKRARKSRSHRRSRRNSRKNSRK